MKRLMALVLLSAVGLWAQSAADDLYKEATAAINKGDLPKAEFWFREMRREAPADDRWKVGLLTALEFQNKLQEALKLARELVAKQDQSMVFHFRLGALLAKVDQMPEAMAEFEAALRYSNTPSEKAVVHNQIGDVHRRAGKLDEAITEFRKAKELTGLPNPVLAITLDQRGDHEGAIAEYRAVLKSAPNLSVALNNLAYTFAELGENLDEALSLARRAVDQSQGNAAYVDTLGWVYFKKGMLLDAEETMVGALVREGGLQPTLRLHLAAVMDARGDWSGDRRELRKLLDGELSANQTIQLKDLLRKIQGR